MTQPVLVVLGLSATGLYVVREAASAGALVYGFSDSMETASSSRYLANRGPETVVDMNQLEARLSELASAHSSLGVIPTTDRHAEFLVDACGRLPENIMFADTYRNGSAVVCLDKAQIAEKAEKAGISTPWSHDLESGWPPSDTLPFPLILKPKAIHQQREWLKGKKLFLCSSETELDQIRKIPQFRPGEWTLQALVDGPESNIIVTGCLRLEDGSIPVTFCGRKLRQYPPNFGSASLLVSAHDDEAVNTSHKLIETLNFCGITGIEFKRSARDNKLYLIEINPRPGLWFGATTNNGDLLIREQLRAWFGSQIEVESKKETKPVLWRYTFKDASSKLFHWKNKDRGVLPQPIIDIPRSHQRVWAVWSSRDPMPAMTEIGGYLRKAISRIVR
jgi:predicted ATP-grasp superfamily ATP-dependent carboligase